jgi:hypothetical protein
MYAVAPRVDGPITPTGVHYLPFGVPSGLSSRPSVALHVADGSAIITNKWNNRYLHLYVGDGTERFGGAIAALDGPHLHQEYLPVLEVGYRDARGVRWAQQSFATPLPGTEQLASYVRITAYPDGANNHATLRLQEFCGSNCALTVSGNSLAAGGLTYLFFSPGAALTGGYLEYQLDLSGGPVTVYLVRVNEAAAAVPATTADAAGHEAALAQVATYWNGRLGQAAQIDVPEPLVRNATRNLLIQNLLTTWRYSLGNAYEAFYQPESNDTIELLGHFGYTDVYKSALKDLLPLSKARNRRNWEIGTKLYHAADYYHLTKDTSLLTANEAIYTGYLEDLIAQHAADPNHLLEKQQYSSDIPTGVYGLHQIGQARRGAQSIAEAWRILGRTDLADKYAAFAADLYACYLDAARRSQVALPDGALFTPVELLSGTQPWDPITATTLGGYFNLVAYYGFSSRVYPPGSDEARRTLKYVYNYGSRLLGMLRARNAGSNTVYMVEQLKFLADNDEADQIVLSFYGKLAHGMTRETFVSGESHNVGPMLTTWPTCRGMPGCVSPDVPSGWAEGEYYRAMYLPPNSANNTSFLEALRLMLVQVPSDERFVPTGLRLGYATPRGWLEHGKTISVSRFPTPFGDLAYDITSDVANHHVHARVDVPSRGPIPTLSLRLRVPKGLGLGMVAVLVNGKNWKDRFDASAETIDLSGCTGRVDIQVNYRTVKDR